MNFSAHSSLTKGMRLINFKTAIALTSGLLLSQVLLANVSAESVKPFPDASLSDWTEKSFVGNTSYKLVKDQGTTVLKANAVKTASVLYKRDVIDLTKNPWLEWSWKIESTYQGIDEKTQGGDDYPARLYVTAQVGLLPWDTIAINYVWSSNQPLNSHWKSPYTDKSAMVSVQSGELKQGQWVSQRRNVVEDFKKYFNVDIKKISGYAVMVDGDNDSRTGTAYFGNIDFLVN